MIERIVQSCRLDWCISGQSSQQDNLDIFHLGSSQLQDSKDNTLESKSEIM